MFLRLLELMLSIIAIALIVTQILLPVVFGRKLFPAFRGSRNKIENEILELQEQLSEKELAAHRDQLLSKLTGTSPAQPTPPPKQQP